MFLNMNFFLEVIKVQVEIKTTDKSLNYMKMRKITTIDFQNYQCINITNLIIVILDLFINFQAMQDIDDKKYKFIHLIET